MTSFGVQPEGFVEKTLQDVLDEVEDAQKAEFGAGVDVSEDAPLGQLNGIFGDQIAELWEVALAIYRALYPDSAVDEALENVSAITGTTRLAPKETIVPLSLNLDPATTVPLGSVVRNSVTGDRFVLNAAATNGAADQANVVVQAQAEQTGPIEADAFSIDEIVTPISGWVAQAAVNSGSAGTYSISFNDTLLVKIDDGAVQTLIFVATAAEIDSGNTEPFALNDGETLTIDVDTGGVDTATFNATAAALENANAETYALNDGETLLVRVDGGGVQTATFNTGDFVDINNATAEEVRDVINTDTTGLVATATTAGTKVTLTSLLVGTDSIIEVTGGTGNGVLGFSTTPVSGSGEFADIANATAAEVAAVINTDIAGLGTSVVAGAVRVTSDSLGTASEIEVTGGTANPVLGFSTTPVNGAQDFADFANVSTADMAAAIDSKLSGGEAADLTTGVVRMQSSTDGPGSAIEVTGGTANSELDFPTAKVAGLNQTDEDTLGTDLETITELRARRLSELRAQGNATFAAILADLLLVSGMIEVLLLENDTNVIDAQGLPPHSVESVADGGTATDEDIAAALFGTKAAGIRAYGETTVLVEDSQGVDHTIKFTRAVEVDIYVELTVTTNTVEEDGPVYPADGDEQVEAAIVAKGALVGMGSDVILEFIKCAAFNVSGVIDVTVFTIDTVTPAVGVVNIPISPRSRAKFDTSRVDVTS